MLTLHHCVGHSFGAEKGRWQLATEHTVSLKSFPVHVFSCNLMIRVTPSTQHPTRSSDESFSSPNVSRGRCAATLIILLSLYTPLYSIAPPLVAIAQEVA